MPDVGDEVLVMPSMGENVAVPLGNVNVGDSVILYQLKDNTRIAVPTLSLSINSIVFNTPSFNFAGFNWNIDFNFQLIPLILNLALKAEMTWTDSNFRTSDVQYFGSGAVFPAGNYVIEGVGWWCPWEDGDSWSSDCIVGELPLKLPLWCIIIQSGGLYTGIKIWGTSTDIGFIKNHLTYKNFNKEKSTLKAEFTLITDQKIGLKLIDNPYNDNRGSASWKLYKKTDVF